MSRALQEDEMMIRRHDRKRQRIQQQAIKQEEISLVQQPTPRIRAGADPLPEESASQFNNQPSKSNLLLKTSSSNLLAEPDNSRAIQNANARRRLCPRIVRNSNDETLLAIDEVLRNRWEIRGLIGSGGYGQIYVARDQQTNENVAIKAEPTRRRGRVVRRMILEQKVLVRLQGQPHVPIIHASGCEREINFIVMQLLSVNVADLRKQCHLRRLSRPTCGRIIQQAIAALRDLHNANFLHRDIKPANLCFGITERSKNRLFLVDYGLVRCYRTTDGKPRPKRQRAGFRGTLRYVSLRVHAREEQGPSDDLVSLFYTLLELLRGELPWRQMHHQNQIRAAKELLQQDDFLQISECFGESLREFGRAVHTMRAEDEPNYAALQDIMKEFSGQRPLDSPYDWEEDYKDVVDEMEINRHLKLIV